MVYLAGNNNLAEEMVYAIKSMELVGSAPPDYEVFALYDSGIGPVPFEIRTRHVVPGGLLDRAERTRQSEADNLVRVTRDELATATKNTAGLLKKLDEIRKQLRPPAKLGKPSAPASDFLKNAFLSITEDAKAQVDELKHLFSAAKAAANGGPEVVDSVETVLTDFVVRTIREHPAEKYMLVLSGHGSGAVGDFLTGSSRFGGLSIPDLKAAMENICGTLKNEKFLAENGTYQPCLRRGRIDILGLDSCLMGMAEVAFEVRHFVDYLVGPQGFEPNTGWPYDDILMLLQGNPAPADLATDIVEKYIRCYSLDYTLADVSTDQSALNLTREQGSQRKLMAFVEALGGPDGLSMLLKNALESKSTKLETVNAVVMAHWRAQGYKDEQHTDVYDFCSLLQQSYPETHPIFKSCEQVKKTIKEALVLSSNYTGPEFQHSHGVSVFFPWASITDAAGISEVAHYKNLEFAKKTHWDEFLSAYHEATQREVRKDARGHEHPSRLNRREGLFTGPADIKTDSLNPKIRLDSLNPRIRIDSLNPRIRLDSLNPRIRMSGSARFGDMPKIASMKNPPVRWKDMS